ncbi:MAG: T9SS type A sorting domain-containing protein [Bacteroidia bacterium]|nr:T9SS type A sorting domain-containing protein [Bacteroidia bacterium]
MFPRDAREIFELSDNNTVCDPNIELKQTRISDEYSKDGDWNRVQPKIITYYAVQGGFANQGTRYYIDYWWTYFRQQDCFGDIGGHDYDWEHIVVQVEKRSWPSTGYQPISVTYFQHKGWYTRRFDDIERIGFHPVSYVGKIAHGNYHRGKDCGLYPEGVNWGAHLCYYFGDCLRTSRQRYFNVWEKFGQLVSLKCPVWYFNQNPSVNNWMAWPGKWGKGGFSPLFRLARTIPYYEFLPSCEGKDDKADLHGQHGCQWRSSNIQAYLKDIPYTPVNSYTIVSKSAQLNSVGLGETLETLQEDKASCHCVTAYPNPVQDVLNLEGVEASTKISIVNQEGEEVMQVSGKSIIDVAALPEGLYLVMIEGKKPFRFIKK